MVVSGGNFDSNNNYLKLITGKHIEKGMSINISRADATTSLHVVGVEAPELPGRVIRHIAVLDAYWRVEDILNQCSNSKTWTPHLTAPLVSFPASCHSLPLCR
jgi:hypothetical protein